MDALFLLSITRTRCQGLIKCGFRKRCCDIPRIIKPAFGQRRSNSKGRHFGQKKIFLMSLPSAWLFWCYFFHHGSLMFGVRLCFSVLPASSWLPTLPVGYPDTSIHLCTHLLVSSVCFNVIKGLRQEIQAWQIHQRPLIWEPKYTQNLCCFPGIPTYSIDLYPSNIWNLVSWPLNSWSINERTWS